MTQIPYREHHLFQLLKSYKSDKMALDLCIHHYFKANPALGSKDRAFIAETVYALTRWRGLLEYLCADHSWPYLYSFYQANDPKNLQTNTTIPPHARVSFPEDLFHLLSQAYGEEEAITICLNSNQQAPTTVRVNTLKTSREALMTEWQTNYSVSATEHSPFGITFRKKMNFFELPEFKKGFFEVQDEGSQVLANLMRVKPGEAVMDYCAGAGGKTLAFAPLMENKGQIYLHDIRPWALQEAKKRLKRAGIQNAQLLLPDSATHPKLKKKMNWVLADVPCTGTGTLRRNPDMKWKFNLALLERLVSQQRVIFEKALSYVKPGGFIVYGTCSLLPQENENQVNHFLKTYPIELVGEPFHSIPTPENMDGFFGATFQRKI